jgi:hypothetical protein
MRYALGLSLIFALSTLGSRAHAQIGDKGTFVLGADRVLGYVSSKVTVDPEGPAGEIETKRNNLAVLQQGDVVSPYSNPRFAFDYFITNGLSLGGSIGYWSQSGEQDAGVQTDLPDQHMFTVAPRIGYGVMFGQVVGIWPRGGFTYFTGESNLDVGPFAVETDVNGFGLNLDLPFVIVPANHFAILAGPGVDFTASGKAEAANADYDVSIFDVGLHVGFVGYL